MGLVSLAQFESALREAAKAEADCALIGGLAVAAWSQRFGILPPDGSDAFYSKDLDVRGDKPAAYALGRILRDEGYRIIGLTTVQRREPPGLGRNFVVSVDMGDLGTISVEVLEKMPLVDSPDLPPQGFALELAGIRILDPLSLMIGKIHAFNNRAAGLANKDAVHLGLLARIVPQFIREARERGLAAEVAERCRALDAILETWKVPFEAGELEAFRAVLREGARG